MDFQNIAHLASAIEAAVVSVAVIGGGAWTVFTFRRLHLTKKAESELAELEQRLSRTAQLNLHVRSSCQSDPDGGLLISGWVDIENVGPRRTHLQFPEDGRPFHLMRVNPAMSGDIELGDCTHAGIPFGAGNPDFSKRAIVGPGATVSLPVVFKVSEPGVYLLSFSAFPATDFQEKLHVDGIPSPQAAQWTGRDYVIVRRAQAAPE